MHACAREHNWCSEVLELGLQNSWNVSSCDFYQLKGMWRTVSYMLSSGKTNMCRGFWDRCNSTPISQSYILGSHTFWEGKYTLQHYKTGIQCWAWQISAQVYNMLLNNVWKLSVQMPPEIWRRLGHKFLGVLNCMIIVQVVFAIFDWKKVVNVYTSANSLQCAIYLLTFSCKNVRVKCGN